MQKLSEQTARKIAETLHEISRFTKRAGEILNQLGNEEEVDPEYATYTLKRTSLDAERAMKDLRRHMSPKHEVKEVAPVPVPADTGASI